MILGITCSEYLWSAYHGSGTILSVLVVLVILKPTPEVESDYPHWTEEIIEAQGSGVTCRVYKLAEPEFTGRQLDFHVHVPHHHSLWGRNLSNEYHRAEAHEDVT